MARKPTEPESRKETISYRVTRSLYNKVIGHVDGSDEPTLSDYARNALLERIDREEKEKNGKSE
jgi:hypothetical protein